VSKSAQFACGAGVEPAAAPPLPVGLQEAKLGDARAAPGYRASLAGTKWRRIGA
jgi:hypothetical protein